MSESLLLSQSPESLWLRATARFCLVWGTVVLALAMFEIWSRVSNVDALQIVQAFAVSGCALLAAAVMLWVGYYRFAPVVVFVLVLAASPFVDPTKVILNAALLSHDRSETVGSHVLALIAVVLTPVVILVASFVLSVHWLRWLRAESESGNNRIAGVPAEAADQPWQAEVEQAEAKWEPPVWRIASALFAVIAIVWIAATVYLRMGSTDHYYYDNAALPTAGLLSPLAGWVAACVSGLMHARVRRVGRWFAVLLMCFVTAIMIVAIGLQIIERL